MENSLDGLARLLTSASPAVAIRVKAIYVRKGSKIILWPMVKGSCTSISRMITYLGCIDLSTT